MHASMLKSTFEQCAMSDVAMVAAAWGEVITQASLHLSECVGFILSLRLLLKRLYDCLGVLLRGRIQLASAAVS